MGGIPALNRNNQPIEMGVLDTVATADALIGRLPIGARHFTKSCVIYPGFVPSERALSPDFLWMVQRRAKVTSLLVFMTLVELSLGLKNIIHCTCTGYM
jgi:hypothetical protein